MSVSEEKRKEVMHRLSRLEGQIRGVRKMIEDGEECEKIVMQLSAAHSAMEGATKLIMVGFFRECLADSENKGEDRDTALDRFFSLLLNTRM